MESPVPFVFRVEKSICDEIDRYCAETGEYRSRAEFGRAAFDAFLDYSKKVKLPVLKRSSAGFVAFGNSYEDALK